MYFNVHTTRKIRQQTRRRNIFQQGESIVSTELFLLYNLQCTASLNEDFEIKNELKKLHTEPFSYMPRHYKNEKKQIFPWEKLAENSKCLML